MFNNRIILVLCTATSILLCSKDCINDKNPKQTKQKTEQKTEQKTIEPQDTTTTYDTLYVIRTQYVNSSTYDKTKCLCVDSKGNKQEITCPDFSVPGDTLVLDNNSNSIFIPNRTNITLERAIKNHLKQR